ncbi:unnamed protein product [Gordionus sp. m RMFG-2023]
MAPIKKNINSELLILKQYVSDLYQENGEPYPPSSNIWCKLSACLSYSKTPKYLYMLIKTDRYNIRTQIGPSYCEKYSKYLLNNSTIAWYPILCRDEKRMFLL